MLGTNLGLLQEQKELFGWLLIQLSSLVCHSGFFDVQADVSSDLQLSVNSC